ncbi:MAG: hypothetical protein ACRERU_16180 [Methylococcales bacterium]
MRITNIKANLTTPPTCAACGAPLTIDPHQVGKIRRFCNDRCKMRYQRGQRPEADGLGLQEMLEFLEEVKAEFIAGYPRHMRKLETIVQRHYKTHNRPPV